MLSTFWKRTIMFPILPLAIEYETAGREGLKRSADGAYPQRD